MVADSIIYKLSHGVAELRPKMHEIEGAKVAKNQFFPFSSRKKNIFMVAKIAKV